MIALGILGSTGSIGRQALEVVEALAGKIKVTALVAGSNVELLAAQALNFRPQMVAIAAIERYPDLKELLSGTGIKVLAGEEGVVAAASAAHNETVLAAIVGSAGLKPTLAAIRAGKRIALANKETLVMAGALVQQEKEKSGAEILPVDSEHSAIWQCLHCGRPQEVESLILTASGGPFRTWSKAQLKNVTVDKALEHPNWSMGAKITVDSATMMNKGLEIIEAKWLFDLPLDKIKVVVHPESIVHSLVEYIDGTVIGQLGLPDMRLPIQLALTYPRRMESPWPRLNLVGRALTFEDPDRERFPSLELARQAGQLGGTAPAVLNAANEVAVTKFLAGHLSFPKISWVVQEVMMAHRVDASPTLDTILVADGWAREKAKCIIAEG